MYYPKSPQFLFELILQSLINSDEYIDEWIVSWNYRILFSPCDYYLYTSSIMASWYNLFKNNKNLKKIIVLWYSDKIKWIWVPSFNNINSVFWKKKIELNFLSYFNWLNEKVNLDEKFDFSDIDVQLPFLFSSMRIECVFPVFVWFNKNYIKLVNILTKILNENNDVWIIISSNFYTSDNLSDIDINKILDNLVSFKINNITRELTKNYKMLKIYSLLTKKIWSNIVPVFYWSSLDLWSKDNNWYFTMLS